jgi:uncharacterized membrane protein YbhN (UPF0104 family)
MALPALLVGGLARRQPQLASLVLLLFAAFLLPLGMAASGRMAAATTRLLERARLRRLGQIVGRSAAAVRSLVGAPRLLAGVLSLSVAMKACVAVTLLLLAASLGLRPRTAEVLLFLPLHTVVSALPLSVNGLGLREANLVGFFARLGFEAEQATSLALLHLLWLYVVALPGVLALVRAPSDAAPKARSRGHGSVDAACRSELVDRSEHPSSVK